MHTAADMMSTIESTAPTSWKCTSLNGLSCAFASASARMPKIFIASALAPSVSFALFKTSVISVSPVCA